MECAANGDPIDMSEALKIYPIQLSSVKEFAENSLFQDNDVLG